MEDTINKKKWKKSRIAMMPLHNHARKGFLLIIISLNNFKIHNKLSSYSNSTRIYLNLIRIIPSMQS